LSASQRPDCSDHLYSHARGSRDSSLLPLCSWDMHFLYYPLYLAMSLLSSLSTKTLSLTKHFAFSLSSLLHCIKHGGRAGHQLSYNALLKCLLYCEEPPEMVMTWPLTQLPSSDARKATTRATSSGTAQRLSGQCSAMSFSILSAGHSGVPPGM